MKLVLCLFSLVVWLGGCQTAHLHIRSVGMDQVEFERMWQSYVDCWDSVDLDVIRAQARRLSRTAEADQPSPPFLPKILGLTPARLPVRLAVDPKALAASCALHGGKVALDRGEQALATDLFTSVIQRFPEPDHAYYVAQARSGLIQASERPSQPFTLLPVSFP